MRPTRFAWALGFSLFAAVGVDCSQAPPPGALPETLRERVRDERLNMVTSVRGMPLGVRDSLQTLFGSGTLDIADTGADIRTTDEIVDPRLPNRRLVAAGCSVNYCLVYYERGGATPTFRVALFHWTPDATRLEWGAAAPGGMKTFEDVRKAVLSGAIREETKVW